MDPAAARRALSGTDLRRLLVLRDRLRQEFVGLPQRYQQEILAALERARQQRLLGRTTPWRPPAMTAAELIREISWRLDVSAVDEVDAAVRILDRARRELASRARRAPLERPAPAQGSRRR